MKHAAVCLVLLLSPLMLAAQNSAKNQGQAPAQGLVIVDLGEQAGDGCPISMRARHGVWDHTIKIQQGQQGNKFQPFGQRIFLTLSSSKAAPIIAATVKVHGLTGKNHMVETAAGASGDATKILKITFAESQWDGVTGDLYIPGFTSVSSIELVEVSYDDGRVWRIGDSGVCRVTPDPLMLIASH